MHDKVSVSIEGGACPVHVFTPDGQGRDGPWPAVIIFMDGLAIRPTLFTMGQRLADQGYLVLLPDLFWRAGPYAPIDVKAAFASGNVRAAIGHLFATTNSQRATSDTAAFLAYLDGRDDVAGGRIGVTGYCMGGAIALTVAGTYPERVAAAASFHGGHLATDAPESPHRLAAQIKARVYVGGADQDAGYPPEMAERLDQALTQAGVEHRCEFYPALHGWTMTDTPVYNHDAAERHWHVLTELFAQTLKV